jgi:hypothetical protein
MTNPSLPWLCSLHDHLAEARRVVLSAASRADRDRATTRDSPATEPNLLYGDKAPGDEDPGAV